MQQSRNDSKGLVCISGLGLILPDFDYSSFEGCRINSNG
jgi:hypothetical protein